MYTASAKKVNPILENSSFHVKQLNVTYDGERRKNGLTKISCISAAAVNFIFCRWNKKVSGFSTARYFSASYFCPILGRFNKRFTDS